VLEPGDDRLGCTGAFGEPMLGPAVCLSYLADRSGEVIRRATRERCPTPWFHVETLSSRDHQ
jgi:hypothetical protein